MQFLIANGEFCMVQHNTVEAALRDHTEITNSSQGAMLKVRETRLNILSSSDCSLSYLQ